MGRTILEPYMAIYGPYMAPIYGNIWFIYGHICFSKIRRPLGQGVLEYKDAANKPRCKNVVSLVVLFILCPGGGGDPPAHTPFVTPSMGLIPTEG